LDLNSSPSLWSSSPLGGVFAGGSRDLSHYDDSTDTLSEGRGGDLSLPSASVTSLSLMERELSAVPDVEQRIRIVEEQLKALSEMLHSLREERDNENRRGREGGAPDQSPSGPGSESESQSQSRSLPSLSLRESLSSSSRGFNDDELQ
jgi:hypothetical protein